MWKLFILFIAVIAIEVESVSVQMASNPHRLRKRASSYAGAGGGSFASSGAGGYAGGYAGTGFGGGGYAGTGFGGGSYAGTDDAGGYIGTFAGDYPYDFAGTGFGYAPYFGAGFIDPYAFHQALTAQILAQNAALHNAIATTTSDGNAEVSADASNSQEDYDRNLAQQYYYNTLRRPSLYNRAPSVAHRYGPTYASNFAHASGSIGPGGYRQTAYISPENPAVPNVVNRFGGESSSPGGYKGVSVSSFSSSSDVDGKRSNQRVAQTSVNDNGKVSTYTVHS